jgi:hypothetical protein
MKALATLIILAAMAAGGPALAADYPVAGSWGLSGSMEKGAIDCAGRRIIEFRGHQRLDSGGGVPAYRNVSVTPEGAASYRIVDEFTTGQIKAGRTTLTLRKIDADHIELRPQGAGGALKLQRCK